MARDPFDNDFFKGGMGMGMGNPFGGNDGFFGGNDDFFGGNMISS